MTPYTHSAKLAGQHPTIPVYQPYLCGREKEYVNQCLDTTWISSKGEFIERFERAFAQYIDAEHITSVCNGTVALHLALAALGIGAGDEVIVPTLTYIASVNAIRHTGATPVLVDSLSASWQLDPAAVREKITPNTRAIMAVHLYGQPCDMDALMELCREKDLLLIEDCAEAFGSYYKGRHVGTFGDVATFSFFGNKTITTGEGGMVICRDRATHERAYHLKTQAVSKNREYWHDTVAYNYRMTNICAAIGLAQLEQADAILEKKRQVAQGYTAALENLPLQVHAEQTQTRHSFWMCSILLDDAQYRQALRNHLQANGIETRPLFIPAHTMPHYRCEGDFGVAESLSARGINLPSYPALRQQDIAVISEHIRAFFAGIAI